MKQYWDDVWSHKHQFNSVQSTTEMPWDIHTHDRNLEVVLDFLKLSSGKVLELGCGSGNDVKFLSDKGFDVTGIDISEIAINIAKERNLGNSAKFIVGDVETDIPKEQYDFIFDRGCIHNCKERLPEIFEKLSSVLIPKGKIILITGNINEPKTMIVKPTHCSISHIEMHSFNWFKIQIVQEITFQQNSDYIDSLGYLFILEKKDTPTQ